MALAMIRNSVQHLRRAAAFRASRSPAARNLRTSRSVNGALSSRAHLTDVTPAKVTSGLLPAGINNTRRPSPNAKASCPSASISVNV